jgi:hypothetical protein
MTEHREHTGFRRRVAALLVAGLVVNPIVTVARTADAAGAATASLDVISEPAGANVYVDGKLAGQTPLQVSALEPGDHRVRVSKDGYLENARIVTISAADTKLVNVKLTPHNGSNDNAMEQVSGGGGGGGGSKKWLWIGLAGGGAAVATVLLLPKNKPPTAGTITTSPTATGMAGVTTFTFTSTASDPDGDALTYSWNFGDGSTGSGASTTKVFNSTGSFNVTVAVSDGKESVTAPGVTVAVGQNLTGTWTGGRDPFSNCAVSLSLTQSSGTLSGSLTFVNPCTGTIPLASSSASPLTHPSAIVVTTQSYNFTLGNDVYQGLVIRFAGSTEASGASMTGTLTTSQPSTGGTISTTTTFRK